MRKLSPLAFSLFVLLGCEPQGESSGGLGNEYTRCNEKSGGVLAEYAKCRCRQLTGAKSWTKEMDECSTNPKMYARGFDGEIPDNIRQAMSK